MASGSTRSAQQALRRDIDGPDQRRPTTDSILRLQRTVGNRGVRTLVLGRERVADAAPVVQRLAYGLDKQTSQDKYVNQALNLWRTQSGMPIKDFADAMMRTIAVELKGYGVPFFRWKFNSGAGALGSFNSRAWKVMINVSKFSARKTPKILKDLTVDEVTEVVGTLYHESRHTDQDVLIIRSLLDQKKKVDQIAKDTEIRKNVINAVSATKYTNPLDVDQIAHAGRMFEVMYGAHKEFLHFLMRNSAAVDGLDLLMAPNSKLSAAKAHLKTFRTWQSAVLQPKLKRMMAVKNPGPVETALLLRLQKVDTSLTALLASWTKATTAHKSTPADVEAVRLDAEDAKDAIVETYVNLEGEQDAFRVEGAVKAALTRKLGGPP